MKMELQPDPPRGPPTPGRAGRPPTNRIGAPLIEPRPTDLLLSSTISTILPLSHSPFPTPFNNQSSIFISNPPPFCLPLFIPLTPPSSPNPPCHTLPPTSLFRLKFLPFQLLLLLLPSSFRSLVESPFRWCRSGRMAPFTHPRSRF